MHVGTKPAHRQQPRTRTGENTARGLGWVARGASFRFRVSRRLVTASAAPNAWSRLGDPSRLTELPAPESMGPGVAVAMERAEELKEEERTRVGPAAKKQLCADVCV